jgi:glycosyltransferase involved in cell wall biosynthesis
MNRPLISIVTPSYNQAAFLPEALKSVTMQERTDVEHIVVDGDSTDDTVSVLSAAGSRSPHLRWKSEPDEGQSHALNKGFRVAQGEIIGWLNADDRYRPGCFDAVLSAFQKYPNIDILYGDYTWIDQAGSILRLRREIEFNRFVLMYHRVLYIPTTSTFFRRRIIDDGHLLDESMQYAMDYELFLRLCLHGYRYRHIPFCLADFRIHPASKSSLAPRSQLKEQDLVTERYAPALNRCSSPYLRRQLFRGLRIAAGVCRYSEKLLRGYYFDRFRRSSVSL